MVIPIASFHVLRAMTTYSASCLVTLFLRIVLDDSRDDVIERYSSIYGKSLAVANLSLQRQYGTRHLYITVATRVCLITARMAVAKGTVDRIAHSVHM